MKLSVYAIYVVACLLACGAATLTGIALTDTFNKQQRQSEDTQLKAGMGQVTAMQAVIQNQMARMRAASYANAQTFLYQMQAVPAANFSHDLVLPTFNGSVFSTWVPAISAPNQLNGFGLTFMYINETTGRGYDRTFQVYSDVQMSGKFEYAFAFTSPADGLCHAWRTLWANASQPVLVEDMYAFDSYTVMATKYTQDDFFDFAQPWSASDGNSYWYFTHLRSFSWHGVWITFQTWDLGLEWLHMMSSILTAGANFVAFDSQRYVMAATNADEVRRLANCHGAYKEGVIPADCINAPADQHPIPEIRAVYTSLFDPTWTDLQGIPIAPTMTKLLLEGRPYMAISGTLFSKNNFRTVIVWYAPWVSLQSDSAGLTAFICFLAVFSTFVLMLLGVFGVLRPLMALGVAMRTVARTLTEGDREGEAVLEPRKPSVFYEVEAIGRDFETIVVDFLGFSSAKARDNRYAPKDTDRPFAVVFTDIQASTGLWGKDPAEMSRCLQIHHELMRQLIKEHRLYEVKTVGDSFMVSTSSPHDAVRFAVDIQTDFFAQNWGWPGADELYRETTLAFDKVPQGPAATATEYHESWNGLRVRVGAHYGMGNVRYDEVSKGYDYYGNVVNTAARIEALAHGGQVVVSEDLLRALPHPLDPGVALARPLGTLPLRGVFDPPALAEVRPAALLGRAFPPPPTAEPAPEAAVETMSDGGPGPEDCPHPRLSVFRALLGDPEGEVPKGHPHHRLSTFSACSRLSSHPLQLMEELARGHALVTAGVLSPELLAQHLLTLYHVVDDLLRPLAPQQHAAVAKALAKGWGVPPPKGKAEFRTSLMCLAHRMSETTKVLRHFSHCQTPDNPPRSRSPSPYLTIPLP